VSQRELGVREVPETGQTFLENALIKARHAAKETGLPALADDSGLVVAALSGAPGIYSARYAGPDASDQKNCQHLLQAMKGKTDRAAFFHATIVFLLHAEDPDPVIAQGRWHGEILTQGQGDYGFGYDPLLYLAKHKKSAAELTTNQKNKLSHRGKALRQLLSNLSKRFPA
jgi:XTP/dITP diphosphohydrolase